MKYTISIVLFLSVLNTQAQEILNQYKYVVVATQYEFQSEQNQYDFNDLTIFLLKKNDFNVLKTGGIFPADYNVGNCNAVNLNIVVTGFLSQNMKVDFVDCAGSVIYSVEGKSREKDYRKAYHECIREAIKSLDDYKYTPKDLGNNDVKATVLEAEEVAIDMPEVQYKEEVKALQPASKNYTYQTDNSRYSLAKITESTFEIYAFNNLVGTMRQIGNGNYIVTVDTHSGLGYFQDKNIVIEYDVEGSLQKLVFLPIAKN